jgi:hypothetical protein
MKVADIMETAVRTVTSDTPVSTWAQSPGRRQTIEMLIDEIGAESFPASDPPAWGVVSSRLEQVVRASG